MLSGLHKNAPPLPPGDLWPLAVGNWWQFYDRYRDGFTRIVCVAAGVHFAGVADCFELVFTKTRPEVYWAPGGMSTLHYFVKREPWRGTMIVRAVGFYVVREDGAIEYTMNVFTKADIDGLIGQPGVNDTPTYFMLADDFIPGQSVRARYVNKILYDVLTDADLRANPQAQDFGYGGQWKSDVSSALVRGAAVRGYGLAVRYAEGDIANGFWPGTTVPADENNAETWTFVPGVGPVEIRNEHVAIVGSFFDGVHEPLCDAVLESAKVGEREISVANPFVAGLQRPGIRPDGGEFVLRGGASSRSR